MKPNEMEWLRDMHKKDTKTPPACVEGETIYTIYLQDFLKMPDVDFLEVAAFDLNVRALLN